MIDREFSVRDYEQGFRDGKHEANAEIERLRAALEPFATTLKGNWSHQSDDMIIDAGFGATDLRMRFRLGDFRAARAAWRGIDD
jgi:hypothetical protein